MTPKAAEELLQVVMYDDFVDRRKALDHWTKRWVATLEVESHFSWPLDRAGAFQDVANIALGARIAKGLLEGPNALSRERRPAVNGHVETTRLAVLLQAPREVA